LPALPPRPAKAPEALLAALGAAPRAVAWNDLDFLVELDDEAQIVALRPDLERLRDVQTRGVIVTARSSTPARDFVSRFFAPALGIPEDPATGSAHAALAPYWSEILGKTELVGYQASARGGWI